MWLIKKGIKNTKNKDTFQLTMATCIFTKYKYKMHIQHAAFSKQNMFCHERILFQEVTLEVNIGKIARKQSGNAFT